jgi:ABC-type bacteriocin/lantibiotic exporter with double-glycine peptidase domain
MPKIGHERMGLIRVVRAAILISGMTACSVFQFRQPPKNEPVENLHSAGIHLLDVPFFADNTDQCGPSVLASILTFWGPPVNPDELKKEIYLAPLKGSLSIDLILAAQKRGFNTHFFKGSIPSLKSELDKGHPLVAFVNRGYKFLPVGHYVVILGYDDIREGLIAHSGLKKNQFISYKRFSKEWGKTENSTLLILPFLAEKGSPYVKS